MSGVGAETGPVLLVGAAGQLGQALLERLARLGEVVAATRLEADLERPDALRALVRRARPRLVVNAAAYTAVDAAETDQERCARVNAVAPGVLAEEAARIGAPIVHFSTNYVFDGRASDPYTEGAEVSPISVYGATKAEGERAVAAANPRHLIVRTSALYGTGGRSFVSRMLELARSLDELRVVCDQLVSPTPAWLVADTTMQMLAAQERGAPAAGIFHVTTRGATSWDAFARRILQLDPGRATHRARAVIGIPTGARPAAARRPANGVLDVGKVERVLATSLVAWDVALARTLPDLAASGP
jgi:dTDP-4-dehydrorhamnose reductase